MIRAQHLVVGALSPILFGASQISPDDATSVFDMVCKGERSNRPALGYETTLHVNSISRAFCVDDCKRRQHLQSIDEFWIITGDFGEHGSTWSWSNSLKIDRKSGRFTGNATSAGVIAFWDKVAGTCKHSVSSPTILKKLGNA